MTETRSSGKVHSTTGTSSPGWSARPRENRHQGYSTRDTTILSEAPVNRGATALAGAIARRPSMAAPHIEHPTPANNGQGHTSSATAVPTHAALANRGKAGGRLKSRLDSNSQREARANAAFTLCCQLCFDPLLLCVDLAGLTRVL
jgi:hypothetical protein